MAILDSDPSETPTTEGASGVPSDKSADPQAAPLTLSDKLKSIADNPGRDLSFMERLAVSAPGRFILGSAESIGGNPVARGAVVDAPADLAATASDLYLGAGQKGAEVLGATDTAKQFEDTRMQVRGMKDSVDNWESQQDKQFSGGETAAGILRGSANAIATFTAGGWGSEVAGIPEKGNALLMQYFATRSTQEALRRNPDNSLNAVFHGLLDGVSVGLGEYLNAPLAELGGTPTKEVESMWGNMLNRATARVVDRTGLSEAATSKLFGLGIQSSSAVAQEVANYAGDTAAGVEKWDWRKFAGRLTAAAASGALIGGAAEAITPIVDAMRARQDALPAALDSEMAAKHDDLHTRELAAGIVDAPVVEPKSTATVEPGKETPNPTAEEVQQQTAESLVNFRNDRLAEFQKQSTPDKLFDLAVREQRVQSAEQFNSDTQKERPAVIPDIVSKEQAGQPTPEPLQNAEGEKPIPYNDMLERIRDAGNIKQQPVSDQDAELNRLADFQNEIVNLKRAIRVDPNADSPQGKLLMADLDHHNALIGEQLNRLAELDTPQSVESRADAAQQILPRTRMQQRLDTLKSQVDTAKQNTANIRQQYKDLDEVKASTRKDALDLVNQSLPPSERGQLAGMAAKVDMPAKLNKFLDTVDRHVARFDNRVANNTLAAALKKADKYVTNPADRAKLSDVISPIDLGTKKMHDHAQTLVDYIKNNPNEPIPEGYEEALQKASQVHKSELSADEKHQIAAAIEGVSAQAAAKEQFQSMSRANTKTEYANNIVQDVSISHPVNSGPVGDVISAAANVVFRPESIMRGLSENLRLLGWENIGVEGHRNQLTFKQQHIDDMTQVLQGADLDPARSAAQTFKQGSKLNEWRYEQQVIGGVPMTRGEAMHIYALSLDPQAQSIMREGGATLQRQSFLRKGDRKIDVNDGTLRDIGEFIGPKGQAIVEHGFQQINGPMRDAVNKQWVDYYNRPLSERENYFPIRRDKDWVMESKDPSTFAQHFESSVSDNYGEFNVTKHREAGTVSPLEVADFLDTYAKHVDTTSRIHAYMGPVRDFYSVYAKPNVKDSIVNATSEATYNGISEAVRAQVLPISQNDGYSNIARQMANNVGRSVLGLRISTPVKHSLGLTVAAAQYRNGPAMLGEAMAKTAVPSEATRMEQLLEQNSPVWKQREGDYLNEATSGLGAGSRSFQPSTLADATVAPVSISDKFANLARGFMAESHVTGLGLDPKDPNFNTEVAKEWERLMARSNTSSQGMEMSGALRAGKANGFIGSLVQFGSGPEKMLSLIQDGRTDIRQGNYKQGVGKLAAYGTGLAFEAAIGAMFATTTAAAGKSILSRMGEDLTGKIPFIGPYLEAAFDVASGNKPFLDPPGTIQGTLAQAATGAGQLTQAFRSYLTDGVDDEGNPKYKSLAKQATTNLQGLAGALTGLPVVGGADAFARIANGLGIEGPGSDELAAGMKESHADSDIKEPTGLLRGALRTDNDAKFIQALQEIYDKNPKQLTNSGVKKMVDGLYSKVDFYERNPDALVKLSPSGLKALNEMNQERTQMRTKLGDALDRNSGAISQIFSKPSARAAGQ